MNKNLITSLFVGVLAMKIMPGQSMGEVSIGDSKETLTQKGFTLDETRSPAKFMKKDQVAARLEKDEVVQIWFEGKDWSKLQIHGKKFPAKKDLASLQKFLKNCESPIQGSGGEIMSCENGGLEITTSYQDKSDIAIAVVKAAVAEKAKGAPGK